MENMVGKKLGPYSLTICLVHGEESAIYLASDEKHAQVYALKVIWHMNEEDALRFQHERKRLLLLKRPDVLPMLDCGEQGGMWYYAMPYIACGTLKDRIIVGRLGKGEVETRFLWTFLNPPLTRK